MLDNSNTFSFLVIAYNHEKYIIDHLESIKYQILNYGKNISTDILISDDCSNDSTVELIDSWTLLNCDLFNRVVKFYNKVNKGTCSCVADMILAIETDNFKLTAGDDIYSFENIYEASLLDESIAFCSGFPLFLNDGELKESFNATFLMVATSQIYKHDSLKSRFINFSYDNAPNMFYNLSLIRDSRVINYLRKFDVTEDWPVQIAISRFFPEKKYNYLNKVLVYYRRTSGSTYLVANNRFKLDKMQIFCDLIENTNDFALKFRLLNRMRCFQIKNKIFSRLINLNLYLFSIQLLFRFPQILFEMLRLNFKKDLHKTHLNLIFKESNSFRVNMSKQ